MGGKGKRDVYRFVDVSSDTDLESAGGPRNVSRAGIVLHATAGVNSLAWLQRVEPHPKLRSSADYLIPPNGDILQITPVGRYAYHVGQATWRGLTNADNLLNKVLVGVEVESLDVPDSRYTNEQYIALAALVRVLLTRHRIPLVNIRTHAEIAVPRGRKTDPAQLSWPVLTQELLYPSWEHELFVFPEVLA